LRFETHEEQHMKGMAMGRFTKLHEAGVVGAAAGGRTPFTQSAARLVPVRTPRRKHRLPIIS
jgi:hypothetical protein